MLQPAMISVYANALRHDMKSIELLEDEDTGEEALAICNRGQSRPYTIPLVGIMADPSRLGPDANWLSRIIRGQTMPRALFVGMAHQAKLACEKAHLPAALNVLRNEEAAAGRVRQEPMVTRRLGVDLNADIAAAMFDDLHFRFPEIECHRSDGRIVLTVGLRAGELHPIPIEMCWDGGFQPALEIALGMDLESWAQPFASNETWRATIRGANKSSLQSTFLLHAANASHMLSQCRVLMGAFDERPVCDLAGVSTL
jgi:hypothetical protein